MDELIYMFLSKKEKQSIDIDLGDLLIVRDQGSENIETLKILKVMGVRHFG
jgi:hypothetical protein